jgi:hypothetical protein
MRTISALVLLSLTLAVAAAPAPFPKTPPTSAAQSVHGTWRLEWAGSVWTMALEPGGSYSARLGGSPPSFVGSWAYDASEKLIWVTESHSSDRAAWVTFALPLAGGKVRHCERFGMVEVRLSRPE